MIGASAVACTKEGQKTPLGRPGLESVSSLGWIGRHHALRLVKPGRDEALRALLSPAAEITIPCISDREVVFAFMCFPLGWVVSASMLSFSLAGNPKPVGGRPRNRTEPSDPQSIASKLCPAASYYE